MYRRSAKAANGGSQLPSVMPGSISTGSTNTRSFCASRRSAHSTSLATQALASEMRLSSTMKTWLSSIARTMVGSSVCPPNNSRTSTQASTKSGSFASASASGLSCQAWLMKTRMDRLPFA